jgi:glycosyltransferase involved in cell wall biosynthesis
MPSPHDANLELAGLDLVDRFRLRSRSYSSGNRAEDREGGGPFGGPARSNGTSEMKVCFISHSCLRGGAELSLLELIDALLQRGVQCACVLPGRGTLNDLLADRGVETIVVPFKQWVHTRKTFFGQARRMLPLRHIPAIFRLVTVIKRLRCDVVYTNTIAVGAGAVAAKIAGKPHIWHIREFGYDDHKLSYDLGLSVSRKLIGRLSSACIANSKAVAEEYRPSLTGTELTVIYNSVEMPTLGDATPADVPWRHDGAIRCVLLGKLLPGKGQEDAVKAMVNLRRMNVPAELLLLGGAVDTEYHQHIERLVEQYNLTDRVHMLGHSDNPMPLINTADVLLMCSRREAFGRVTVEGMKLGKPVIGTRSGGTPEIVQEGETGFLYTPGDAQELAAKIGHLYANRAVRDSMGTKACRCAQERFNQRKYGRDVENILQRVVRSRNRLGNSRLQKAA